MITEIREYGSIPANQTDELMNYNIEIKFDIEDNMPPKTFTGTDVNEVLQKSMKFIIKHYKSTN